MDEDEYQALADCIRSGQVPEAAVVEIMRDDPGFESWYRNHYLAQSQGDFKREGGFDTASRAESGA